MNGEHTMPSYLRNPDITLNKTREHTHRLLPYPTHVMQVQDETCQVYEIPEEKMQEVLDEINPWRFLKNEKLNAEDMYYDGHKNRRFRLKKALIIRFERTNHIVSPWFASHGSSWLWIVKWRRGMVGYGKPMSLQ